MCGCGIPGGQRVLGRSLAKHLCKQDLWLWPLCAPLGGGSGQFPQDGQGLRGAGGRYPRAVLTMTISPGIGVGSLSRNLTFNSLTGTSSARLSAEMVSSAGLLWGSAVSTAASVCGRAVSRGPRAGGGCPRRALQTQARPSRLPSGLPPPRRPSFSLWVYPFFRPAPVTHVSPLVLPSFPFRLPSSGTARSLFPVALPSRPTLKRAKQPIWRGRRSPTRLGSWDTSTCSAAPLVSALTTGSDNKVDRTPSCSANIPSCGAGGRCPVTAGGGADQLERRCPFLGAPLTQTGAGDLPHPFPWLSYPRPPAWTAPRPPGLPSPSTPRSQRPRPQLPQPAGRPAVPSRFRSGSPRAVRAPAAPRRSPS